jgi:hypothetical protein
MANTNSQYETLYGVGLLDDLHNYFPALLYDSGRFHSVPQVLHYLQTNARNRFDLFSFGQRSYLSTSLDSHIPRQRTRESSPIRSPVEPTTNQPASEMPPLIRTNEPRISTHIEITQEDLGIDNQALSLLNLMNVLTGMAPINRTYRNPNLPNSFLEPVIVRPTPEQIEHGSVRAFPSEDTTCAICQDGIPVNQMARRLNACGHTFHISCIDQWFGRDVRCPTCRHDIREPAPQQQEQEQSGDEESEEVN